MAPRRWSPQPPMGRRQSQSISHALPVVRTAGNDGSAGDAGISGDAGTAGNDGTTDNLFCKLARSIYTLESNGERNSGAGSAVFVTCRPGNFCNYRTGPQYQDCSANGGHAGRALWTL